MTRPAPAGGPGAPGLILDDILDLRAYERVREDFRRRVIERKRSRRIPLGPVITVVFESVDTVRFQIQEMARVEKIVTDEGIQGELDVYNRLLPTPGELSATLFIELTSEEEVRGWLPGLVGIERAVAFSLPVPAGSSPDPGVDLVRSVPEASHAEALTRETVTPAVHYLRFPFTEAQVEQFRAGPVSLVADHPAYWALAAVPDRTRHDLLGDLEGTTVPLALG